MSDPRQGEGRKDALTPDALETWRRSGLTTTAAQALFQTLAPIPCEDMLGTWDGYGLPTDHPLDGLLELHGWRGKRFRGLDTVDPLLFGLGRDVRAISPAVIPHALVVRPPAFARTGLARRAVRLALPLLAPPRPAARLRPLGFAGQVSAAMVYDRLPIIDHFRRIDHDRVLGLMDYRDMPAPLFFLLSRATSFADRELIR